MTSPDTPGGRALADWLVDHWLQDSGYTAGNVLVFDFYNVLSSKTGGGASDVGLATRQPPPRLERRRPAQDRRRRRPPRLPERGDSHPNAAGDQKATAEFVPLLNAAYNAWKGNGGARHHGPRTFAPHAAAVRKGERATLYYRVTDDLSAERDGHDPHPHARPARSRRRWRSGSRARDPSARALHLQARARHLPLHGRGARPQRQRGADPAGDQPADGEVGAAAACRAGRRRHAC